MSHIEQLESEAIFILREVVAQVEETIRQGKAKEETGYYAKDWEIEKSEKVWGNPNKKTETEETK